MDYPFEDNRAWEKARAMLLAKHDASQPLVVLDVGCHTGNFLDGLPKAWTRLGIESAVAPIEVASRRGIRVIAERIESVSGEWQGRCDVVTMFDVLEHLPDPADGIARAAALLRPGGKLLLSTADMDAWTWRWSQGRHWYLQTPQHLSFASRPFLRHVAGRTGTLIERIISIPHRQEGFGSRCRQLARTLYWEMRARGGWLRLPQRLMHSLPGCSSLRHMEEVPWSMSLRDHLLAVLSKPDWVR
jgi:SAM-dependent methyltransferase